MNVTIKVLNDALVQSAALAQMPKEDVNRTWVDDLTPSERLEWERMKLEAAKLIGTESVAEWWRSHDSGKVSEVKLLKRAAFPDLSSLSDQDIDRLLLLLRENPAARERMGEVYPEQGCETKRKKQRRKRLRATDYLEIKTAALDLRRDGMSVNEIIEIITRRFNHKIHHPTLYQWIRQNPGLSKGPKIQKDKREDEASVQAPEVVNPQSAEEGLHELVAEERREPTYESPGQEQIPIEEILPREKKPQPTEEKAGRQMTLISTCALAQALDMGEGAVEQAASLGGWPKNGMGMFIAEELPFHEQMKVKKWLSDPANDARREIR